MEELYELRRYIEMGDTAAALALLDEMDEMSKDDKIQKVASFMRVLLIHMIKQAVEHRTTKSWEVSIRHALRQIAAVNRRLALTISRVCHTKRPWLPWSRRMSGYWKACLVQAR